MLIAEADVHPPRVGVCSMVTVFLKVLSPCNNIDNIPGNFGSFLITKLVNTKNIWLKLLCMLILMRWPLLQIGTTWINWIDMKRCITNKRNLEDFYGKQDIKLKKQTKNELHIYIYTIIQYNTIQTSTTFWRTDRVFTILQHYQYFPTKFKDKKNIF